MQVITKSWDKLGQNMVSQNFMGQLQKARMSVLFFGLGVMFAGMAVQRAMQGLLQPALEIAGVFDIISSILTLLFLPAVLLLLDPLIWILGKIVEMPNELKVVIGLLAMAFFVLGGIAMLLGQFATLVSSLIGASAAISALQSLFALIASGSLVTSATAFTASLAGLLASPLGIAAMTVGTIILGKLIWDAANEKGEVAKNAPFIYEGVTGASALAQQIPVVGGVAGAGVEVLGGIVYWIGDTLFGERGLLRDKIVSVLAGQPVGEEAKNPLAWSMYPVNQGSIGVNTIVNNNIFARGISANTEIEQLTSRSG
jgi:hypothetical protein